jgi:hypothetical protein
MKKCNTCGEEKELTAENWQRQAKARDGFKGECKDCSKLKGAEYRASNNISDKRSIYTEDDTYHMVEDDTMKIITLQCWSGCGNKIDILFDTSSGRRLPRKICGVCKNQEEEL